MPFETKRRARRTYEVNRRVRPSAGNVLYFYPYPHTELKAIAERHDLLLPDYQRLSSYTEAPSIRPVHIPHGELRRLHRKIRIFLLLRKFESYYPLPRPLKRLASRGLWAVFSVHPALVELLLRDSAVKRWIRRKIFRVASDHA